MKEKWTQYWFKPQTSTNLGICRILFYAWVLYLQWDYGYIEWASVSDVFWMPVTFFKWVHIPLFSESVLASLSILWKLSLLASMIGLFTQVSTFTTFVLGFYLLGLPHNFGKLSHASGIIVLILLVMAISRCGDGSSLDGLIRRWRHRCQEPQLNGEYTWPIRLVQLLTVLVFCAAGIAKLKHTGWAWIASDNMANLLLFRYYTEKPPNTSIGFFIASHPWLYQSAAAAVLFLETLAPLALFNRLARMLIIPGLLGMLITFPVILGFEYAKFYSPFIFWVPWNHWGRRFFHWMRGTSPPVGTNRHVSLKS